MKGFKFLVLLLVLCGWLSGFGFPEIYCKIKGRVIDAETKEGIPDVFVNLHLFRHDSPEEFYTFSDTKGYFTFSNVIAGRYCLSYAPLYPYVMVPDREQLRIRWEDSFVLNKGEIKYIERKLSRGGEIIVNFNIPNGNFFEYEEINYYLDRIEGDEIIKNILSVHHPLNNPKFKLLSSGTKFSGLAPGEYILCWSFSKRPQYASENDLDYAGVIKTFTLNQLERKELAIDYNSKSKIILDIKDKDGNQFNKGYIELYKKIIVKNNILFYNVWKYRVDSKNSLLNPVIVEPGVYIVDIEPGELLGKEGAIIDYGYESNFYLINVPENESKILNLFVSIEGNADTFDLEDYNFIH